MLQIKEVIQDRELITLIFIFCVISILGKVFGSTDVTAVSVGFSAGQAHFFLLASNIGAIALFISIRSNSIFRVPKPLIPYLLLAIYALLSSLWSPNILKSGGLAVLAVFNIVWAICIAHSIRRFPSGYRLTILTNFWAVLVIIDFVVELAFKGLLPNLDEYSMIAFSLGSILLLKRRIGLAVLLWTIGLSGQSLSAVLGLMVFWYFLLLRRRPITGTLFIAVAAISIQFAWEQVLNGQFTVYGKNAELIVTGSGRFNAWSAVSQAISSSTWPNFLFGHGYSSDRQALVAQNLSWSVDVHNNILHVFYGLGLVGISLFSFALFSSLRKKVHRSFSNYTVPILTSSLFFGMTSSYFFGRPSDIAIFWLTFLAVGIPNSLSSQNFRPRAA